VARKEPDPYELNPEQIEQVIKLARIGSNDVFYDLGCASGKVVIQVVKQARVKKAIGIELKMKWYQKARVAAVDQLSKQQLKRTQFWIAPFDLEQQIDTENHPYYFKMKDATVVLESIDEDNDTVDYYRTQFGRKSVRIVRKDLPLVGYASKADRSNDESWFFLMTNPLTRIRKKSEWVRSVMGTSDATIDEVYEYYADQLNERFPGAYKETRASILELKLLVNDRF
jgi:hypothetical protein